MRKSKFLNVTFALAMVAGLFAASVASVGAVSPVYGPEIAGTPTIYFPFVYHGTMLDGMGPFEGSVTIQNQNALPISVDITDASGAALATGVNLNPRASKTWSATQLGLADGGSGVIATASWPTSSIDALLTLDMCAPGDQFTETVTHGAQNGVDPLAHTPVEEITNVTQLTDGSGAPLAAPVVVDPSQYDVSSDNSGVDWDTGSPVGNPEPPTGAQYSVTYFTADCGTPTIGGVEKHVAPTQNAVAVKTDADQTTVDGYSAVGYCDLAVAMDEVVSGCDLGQGVSVPELDLENQSRWILPIAQTNTGWDSIIHVTNISGNDGVGVSALFYAADGQGFAGPSEQLFSTTLNSGQTETFDLMNDGDFPVGQVGSVWIDADAGIVASVDRVKPSTDMALTNVAQPRNDNALNYFQIFGQNPTVKYAPLIFKAYNNWNSGIDVANLSSEDNTVTVTFYNYLDNSTSSDTKTIPARAMEYFYWPGTGTDLNLGASGISAAIVSGTQPIAAEVDEVKYTGGQGEGHAMSYPAQYGAYAGFAWDTSQFPFLADIIQNISGFGAGRVFYNWELDLPLLQKGSNTTGLGDYSGINLFNADPSEGVTAWVQFVDTAGIPVAPTTKSNEAEQPIQIPVGALSSHTIYTADYSELPDGFVGSAVVGVVYPTLAEAADKIAVGPLVGVSNNVNYDVSGDGSSAFSMNTSFHFLPNVPEGCLYPGFSFQVGGPLACIP